MQPGPISQQQQTLKIRTLGMDERACKILDMAFNGPGKQCYQLVDADEASVTIIDMDAVGASEKLQQCQQQYSGQPIIVLSVRERSLPDVGWIKKPVKITLLFRLLDDLKQNNPEPVSVIEKQKLQPVPAKIVAFPEKKSRPANKKQTETKPDTVESGLDFEDMSDDVSQVFCGKTEDVDLSDLEQRKSIYYAPERYFQAIFKKAIDVANSTGKAIRIDGIQKSIIVLPDRQGVLTAVDDRFLRALCYSPAIQSAVSFEPVIIDLDEARSSDDFVRLDIFIWKTCLLSSQGRIPAGTNVSSPVRVCYWPNFTRLTITPHAMRIISLWSDEPRSLVTTARMLGIEQRFVFSLFSAAWEMGYVDIKSEGIEKQTAESESKKIRSHKSRGLLGRILHHLGAAR